MQRGLVILQWNCRGIYRKLAELKQFIYSQEQKPDIIILQETHLTQKYKPSLENFMVVRKDKTIHSGGLAIFIRRDMTFTQLDSPFCDEIETILIKTAGFIIGNVYVPPGRQPTFDFIEKHKSRIILFGDFNAYQSPRILVTLIQ